MNKKLIIGGVVAVFAIFALIGGTLLFLQVQSQQYLVRVGGVGAVFAENVNQLETVTAEIANDEPFADTPALENSAELESYVEEYRQTAEASFGQLEVYATAQTSAVAELDSLIAEYPSYNFILSSQITKDQLQRVNNIARSSTEKTAQFTQTYRSLDTLIVEFLAALDENRITADLSDANSLVNSSASFLTLHSKLSGIVAKMNEVQTNTELEQSFKEVNVLSFKLISDLYKFLGDTGALTGRLLAGDLSAQNDFLALQTNFTAELEKTSTEITTKTDAFNTDVADYFGAETAELEALLAEIENN